MATKRGKIGYAGFKERPLEALRKRQNQTGGNRESWLKDSVKVWIPPAGKSKVRILPPTWEDASHYGQDVYVHYGIGTDRSSYVCLDPKKNEGLVGEGLSCPLCAARQKHQNKGNEELAQALAPNKRVCAWIIDRNKESDGPQLWPMPYTVDKDIASQSQDDETKEVIYVDDPDKGYDIILNREGVAQKTKYQARLGKEVPLSRDDDLYEEWLEYVTENPIPDMIVVLDPDHLETALAGGIQLRDDAAARRRKPDDDEDEDEKPRRRRRAVVDEDEDEDEEDEKPPRRRSKSGVDDEEDELAALRGEPRKRRRVTAEDEADEDEDEPPRRRRRDEPEEVTKPKLRGKQARDEDEDEDDVDEAPRGRSARLKARETDDEEDTEEADEEERPARRGAAAAKAAKRSSRATDPDEDEDEDDNPPKRGATGRSKLSGVSRRR